MEDRLLALHSDGLGLSLLEVVLASIPDAAILIDEAGMIQAFSRSSERLFGYSAAEAIGRNIDLIMGGDDALHHDQYIRNYLTTGEKQIIGTGRIVIARRADGESFPVHLTIAEAVIDGRRMFAGYVRDVTEQQAADHKMSALQAELAGFSRLSTVGTMASAMAHELNQPLTAVANYLEAARDMLSSGDEETLAIVREALDAAARQSVRAGQIVRRLRDYVSRGEFEKRSVDIHSVIEEAIPLSKLGVEGRLPRIIFKPAEEPLLVFIDRLQIRQVLLNLLRNATEALVDVSNPLIHVRAWQEDEESVIVEVRDNGPGLPKSGERSPFEPFQSSKADGMGLGLSICQTIVEAHDGEIWTCTEPDSGAIFRFSLTSAG